MKLLIVFQNDSKSMIIWLFQILNGDDLLLVCVIEHY